MEIYDLKNEYMKKGGQVLAAYSQAIEERRGQEEKLNELAFVAADFAHTEALKLLFDAGASPAATDRYGFTLLHFLARRNESGRLGKGLRPEGAITETVNFLLDNNVSALRKDENENMTCYHYAARNGLAEMVTALAARKVKLNMTDRDGNTGIHIACEYIRSPLSNIGFCKKDWERAKQDYEEWSRKFYETAGEKYPGKSADQLGEEHRQYIKSTVFNDPDDAWKNYEEAVQQAEDYFLTVKAFAEGGVDIDEKNSYGVSALDVAVQNDAKKIAAYLAGTLSEDDESSVAAGGMTLHQAAEKGDTEAIMAIAKTGADLNSLNDSGAGYLKGCTPLGTAVAFLKADAVEALLSCGADPSFKDGSGRTASYFLFPTNSGMSFSENTGKIVKDMVSAGMSIDITVNDESDTLLTLACRRTRGMTHNGRCIKMDVITEIMKHKPDLGLADRSGGTALMYACADDFDIMENIQIILLERGADVSAADRNGDTALHYAARNRDKAGAKALCDMLLEFGADANAVNNGGQTALDIATEQNNEPLVKLILSKM